jgi:hypothetical protein
MLLGRRYSSLKTDIVVYEKLNMLTLLLCFINRFRYKKQYFIDFNPFIKKHFLPFVNKNKIQQINLYAFLGPHRMWRRSHKLAVENVNKIMQINPKLAEPFTAYFKDDRAISIIKRIYTLNLAYQSQKCLMLKEFCSYYKDNLILYFPTENNLVIEYLAGSSANVKILRWHFVLLYLVGFLKNLMCFIGLVICPFYLLLRIVKYSRITIKFNSKKVIKKALFVHVDHLLNSTKNIYRNMYLFNINILKMSDCIHTCFRRPLSTNKINYIKEKGGFVLLDYQKQNICMSLIFKKLVIKFYKCFFVYFYSLAFNKFISFQMLGQIIAVIYKSVLFENLLAWMDVKFAFFESEVDTENSIFTIIAKGYNVKTITMLHGTGAYCNTCYMRSNTVVNYYIVSGEYYNRYLKPSCPHVDEFYTIGIHERENINDNKSCLHYLKKDGRKIVGVLPNFYQFFPVNKFCGAIFDENDLRNAFLYSWQPFFEWASKQKDVFFIFKGKNNGQFEHPFLKEQIAKISSDRYYQDDDIIITDVLDVSDCIICSGESSVQFNSLASGVPAIAYEFLGYVDSKRYSEYLVAEEPDEFLLKLEYLMSHGLPGEVYRNFCRDHNLSNSRSSPSSLRIKKLIDKLMEK